MSLQLLVVDLRFAWVSNYGMLVIAGTSSCLVWQQAWKFKKCARRFLIVPITGAKVVSACHAASQWQFALKALRELYLQQDDHWDWKKNGNTHPHSWTQRNVSQLASTTTTEPNRVLVGLRHASSEELKALNLETSVVTYSATVSAVV